MEMSEARREEVLREFHAYVQLFEDEILAREFHVSRPTIARWKDGSNAPHPFLAERALEWMKAQGARLST